MRARRVRRRARRSPEILASDSTGDRFRDGSSEARIAASARLSRAQLHVPSSGAPQTAEAVNKTATAVAHSMRYQPAPRRSARETARNATTGSKRNGRYARAPRRFGPTSADTSHAMSTLAAAATSTIRQACLRRSDQRRSTKAATEIAATTRSGAPSTRPTARSASPRPPNPLPWPCAPTATSPSIPRKRASPPARNHSSAGVIDCSPRAVIDGQRESSPAASSA